jgi:hypothetical protein
VRQIKICWTISELEFDRGLGSPFVRYWEVVDPRHDDRIGWRGQRIDVLGTVDLL